MKSVLLIFALVASQLNAQGPASDGPETTEAQFAGGREEPAAFFASQMHYPEMAAVRHVEGSVVLTFTIDTLGAVRNIKIRSGLGHGCDQEALRLVQNMPRWKPATLNGRPIASGKTVRVDFRMTY